MSAMYKAERAQVLALLLVCTLVVGDDQDRVQAIIQERHELSRRAHDLQHGSTSRRSGPLSKLLHLMPGLAKGSAQRGIIFPSGNSKQLANAYIGARMIRKLGCSLPIEIAVYGSSERPDTYHQKLLKVK